MNRKRLKQIIADLKSLTPKQRAEEFNMAYWKKSNCTTAACAIGWHCTKHPRVALKLRLWKEDEGANYFCPAYEKNIGMGAVSEYLGIREHDADFLFSFRPGDTVPVVISRLEQFMSKEAVDA